MSFQRLMADRFLALYGPPQTDNPRLFFEEYKRCFDGMDPEILTAAVNLVVSRREFPSWPTIGECNKAVERVAEHINASRALKRQLLAPPSEREPTPAARARVTQMIDDLKRKMAMQSLGGRP